MLLMLLMVAMMPVQECLLMHAWEFGSKDAMHNINHLGKSQTRCTKPLIKDCYVYDLIPRCYDGTRVRCLHMCRMTG